MKKYLLICFVVPLILTACDNKRPRHRKQTAKIDSVTVSALEDIEIDSSILSLKSMRAAPLQQTLCQLWKMDDATQKYWNYLLWDSTEDKRKYPELALYNDFSATENARCKMRIGKWKINKEKRELTLNFSDGTNEKYFIKEILLQKMVFTEKINDDDVDVTFISDGLAQKKPDDDPFHPSNNLWRIKPKQPETEEQIIDRLKQCVHFYSLFFQDNHRRGSKEISFTGLPNCFEWYNGGIGVPKELDLDKKWIDCFYSEKTSADGVSQG